MSNAKMMSLIPILGGIYFACNQQTDFAWTALIAACMSNFFSVYKVRKFVAAAAAAAFASFLLVSPLVLNS
eukprot:750244-Hanusia_phi.AAC.3